MKAGSALKHEGVTFASRKRVCTWCQKTSAQTPTSRIRETVHGCFTCNIYLHKGTCFLKFRDVEVFSSGQFNNSLHGLQGFFRLFLLHVSRSTIRLSSCPTLCLDHCLDSTCITCLVFPACSLSFEVIIESDWKYNKFAPR